MKIHPPRCVLIVIIVGSAFFVGCSVGRSSSTPIEAQHSYSTNFPLTETPISEGGKWTNASSVGICCAVKTISGAAYGMAPDEGADSAAIFTDLMWLPDQSVEETIHLSNVDPNNYQEVEIRLRTAYSAGPCTDSPAYPHQTSGPCGPTYNINASIAPTHPYVQSGLAYGPVGNVCNPGGDSPCFDTSPLAQANCSLTFPGTSTSICTFAEGDTIIGQIQGSVGSGGNVVTAWHTQTATGNVVQLFQYRDTRSWVPQNGSPGIGFYYQKTGFDNSQNDFGISRVLLKDTLSNY